MPATDSCSTCLSLKEEIKRANQDNDNKIFLNFKLDVHKAKAASFYRMLKTEEDDTIVLTTLTAKKTWSYQNYRISRFTMQDKYIYIIWLSVKETLPPHGIIRIHFLTYGSKTNTQKVRMKYLRQCMCDVLAKLDLPGEKSYTSADGCGGQNKNTIIVTMLLQW